MADALVSVPVAGVAGAIAVALLALAVHKVRHSERENIIPLMGVLGAFIFAAQMINFTIPGTGSSGHIVGGILLASILGPWAALITLASVLVIQCLIFADGGLMALGCNIINMGVFTCLVAYPLIFRPLIRNCASLGRILWVSILACVVGLELGAFAVTLETEASGVTMLPISKFLLLMLPIHLPIGIGEGLATAAVVYVVQKSKPELLISTRRCEPHRHHKFGWALASFAVAALAIGGVFSWVASSHPDGLEWSIGKITGGGEIAVDAGQRAYAVSENIVHTTALMPDYSTSAAGLIGGGAILLVTLALSQFVRPSRRSNEK